MTEDIRQKVFFFNVSTYLELINKHLSTKYIEQPLGKHIRVLGGFAFKSSEYQTEGIPVIRISDFNKEKIDLSSVRYYKESSDLDGYTLKEGDIIIAMTGGTIGKLGIVQKGLGNLYLNQRVGKFDVSNRKEFFDEYIYWIAKGVQEKIKEFGYGGAQPNISGTQIEELKFPIPDIETQKSIVKFLTNLRDNNLENKDYFDRNTEKQIKKLQLTQEKIFTGDNNLIENLDYIKKLRQSILSEAVQGKLVPQDTNDEPASELLKKIKAEKEKLIKEKKIKKEKPLPPISEDETPYELPNGWGWVRLQDVFDVRDGTHDSPKYVEIGIPLVTSRCFENGKINFGLAKNISIKDHKEIIKRSLVEKEDILFSMIGGNLGNMVKVDTNREFSVKNVALFKYYNKELTPPDYLHLFLRNLASLIQEKSAGGAQPFVALNFFRNHIFSLPPLPEQKRIVQKVDQLMKLCDELEEQVKENQKNSELLMEAVLREAFEA